MTPLVSIIIPVYNSETYIYDTIISCLRQSYTNLEVIVVNDGSTDNSELVIQKLEDNRIKYFKITNCGPCDARNYGISKATGELYQFLDHDDILDSNKIEQQVLKFLEYGNEYIYSGSMGHIINDEKSLEKNFDLYYKNLTPLEYFNAVFSDFGKYLTTGVWLVPSNIINKSNGWDSNAGLNDDGEYFMRLILNCKEIIYCPQSYFYFRRDVQNSVSKQFGSKQVYEKWLYSYLSYVKNFKIHFSDTEAKQLGRKALSVYYCNSYPNYPDLLRKCKEQINALGFRTPIAYGGKKLTTLSKFVGVEAALKILQLKRKLKVR